MERVTNGLRHIYGLQIAMRIETQLWAADCSEEKDILSYSATHLP
jgi:hypothetical protein